MNAQERESIRQSYEAQGYCFPIPVMSAAAAAGYRAELERLERATLGKKLGFKNQLNYPHVLFRFAYEIVSTPAVLDAVEAVLGPDLLLWGSTFFIKDAGSGSYVSWHQDLRYWGLEDAEGQVSAWLALSPVTVENGCMRFVPGSHRGGLVVHEDVYQADNILTRGQAASVAIDEEAAVPVTLRPGELSLHHGLLLHSSAPNRSAERRIGFTMNFIRPSNRQRVAARDYAMLLRGQDAFGHFGLIPPPAADLTPEAWDWHATVLGAQDAALYEGTAQR